ncbi:MAG TPA: hypothetical protein VGM33_02880 [Baekduia sp.]|jgi:hypothetical protein
MSESDRELPSVRPAQGVYPSPEELRLDPMPLSLGNWQDDGLRYSLIPWRRRRALKRAAERAADFGPPR